ncbi:MAG: type II secretion system protein [Gammaproteobacteria bacterium]|nr:type II secretion system protein [Gammaproteobacteria bacterium]
MFLKRCKQYGFTLVELLIVAIMLAILAAIVVPQFASTTVEASESALKSDLAGIRSSIDLYRQQHGEYPGANLSSGLTCTAGAAGTGAAGVQQALEDQLAFYTNDTGQSCTGPDPTQVPLGPYFKGPGLPANPITGSNAVVFETTGILTMAGSGAGLGWRYDTSSGKFIANDTNNDSRGVPFDTY